MQRKMRGNPASDGLTAQVQYDMRMHYVGAISLLEPRFSAFEENGYGNSVRVSRRRENDPLESSAG